MSTATDHTPRRRIAHQTTSRADIYTRVTQQIVTAIETGAGECQMPWHNTAAASAFPKNAMTDKRYRGVNVLSLWAEAQLHGYPEATWATFKQWGELGQRIRSGEKASIAVFWKPLDCPDPTEAENAADSTEADENSPRWVARAFPVFNVAQLENYQAPSLPPRPGHERIADAEVFMAALGAEIRHGGDRAYYRPSTDHIQMPPFNNFVDPIAYYSVLAHETTHWTGHSSRLNRDLGKRFGNESYAAEELIAELGAAFIAADLGLSPEPKPENAAYISHWLSILKADSRAIFTAASHAQRAADYLHSLQPIVTIVPEPEITAQSQQPQLTLAL